MISVVMPVLNEERLVGRAVRSILDQTYRDLELIVVDNGSLDRTRDVLAGLAAQDARIHVLEEPRKGCAHARNRGIAHASHPWIAVQDADDVSHPQRLGKLLDYVRIHPRAILVGSWAVCYSERTGLREPFHHATTDFGIRCQLRTGPSPFVHSSVIFRRDACLQVGGYAPGYCGAEDYGLWARLRCEGSMANLPMHLLVYRHQERAPKSLYRIHERIATERLMKESLLPAKRWTEWVLRLTRGRRLRRAIERIPIDWPSQLARRYGLEKDLARRVLPRRAA